MSTVEVKYDIAPHDGTPGKPWEDFEDKLLDFAASKTDDRGYSLADCFQLLDEGSAGGPAIPGGAAAAKAQIARRRRLKESYGLLVRHELDEEHRAEMKANHFQDGPAAFAYMMGQCRLPVDRLQLRKLDKDWDELDLLQDVGINENSILMMAKHIKAINAKRPAGNRKDQTACGDRMLELIFSCSKHFSQAATVEYNAQPADWEFAMPAGGPAAGQRDFNGLTQHFHMLWRQAVLSNLPGFHKRAPAAKPAKPVRTTLEAGLQAVEGGEERACVGQDFASEAGTNNTYVPRSVSPTQTLHLLADAGDDIAGRHGTMTTSDFGLLTLDECDSCDEVAYVFDDRDTASVELSCHNCGGLGHIARVCPSPRKQRTIGFIISTLQARQQKLSNTPMRRPPGRGQQPPFRSQPRRYQPARRSDGSRVSNQRPRASYSRRSSAHSAEEGESEFDTTTLDSASLSEGGGNSSSGSELARSVRETSAQLNTTVKQPTIFSDDQLFEEERLRVASEAPIARRNPWHLPMEATLLSLAATVAAILAYALEGVERIRALGGIATVTVMLVLLGRACAAPIEQLLPASEVGHIAVSSSHATIDSGATSTAIPESRGHLLKKVTDHNPGRKIWIADDKGLEILKIGEMDQVAVGFRLTRQEGVEPRFWPQTPCRAVIPSTRTLVVRGLGEDTMLYSVRGLKRDGVKTFLNDDNSIQREDCLLLADGCTVIPFANTHAYQVALGATGEAAAAASDVTSRRSRKVPLMFHAALGHAGQKRLHTSNIVIDGVRISELEHDHSTCTGCRLGNTGRHQHKRWVQAPSGSSRDGFTHFGQQVDTDICTGFQSSFPHGFTSMVNFNDRHTIEKGLYFMRSGESAEICSSLEHYHHSNESRLRDGKIGRWLTDNSKSFLGHQTEDCAQHLAQRRGYSVPNDSGSLPVPERHWGVLERMMRSMHAGAADSSNPKDTGAPQCLWTWAANQSNLLLHYLPTNAHNPPMSPHQFVSKDDSPVDLSWARVMFCDVTVTVPDRDVDGKISMRSADGCHLGYDRRRHCHFVFIESLHRLTSCHITEWREDSFILCKRISADTPVEYFEAHDLPYSSATSNLIAHRHTVRARRELGAQLRSGMRVLVLFHRERPMSLMAFLRDLGHAVKSRDKVDGCDLIQPANQHRVLDELSSFDFVFLCPPCTTANIAFDPPLRTFPHFTRGVSGLTTRHQRLVDEHNVLFDFTAEVIHHSDAARTHWALESCASRRRNNAARWPRYHSNAFIWDYPPIERTFSSTPARVRTCATCRFQAPWQKYTDLGSSDGANVAFDNIFADRDCICTGPHAVILTGYDEHGVARTAVAADYVPPFASALAHAIDDTCRSGKEGDDDWASSLAQLDRCQLTDEMAKSILEAEEPDAPVTHGLSRADIKELHAQAHRERIDLDKDLEIAIEDSEGGYISLEEHAFRVSEVGSELSNIKTVAEAKASKFWPLFKAAMESEIQGKMENAAWTVVARPVGVTVHGSRWVFAIKLHDDNSISVVKARFVGCGYSQVEGRDYESVFAATLPGVSFRLLVCMIADEDLETDQIDAVKAFTQAGIDKDVYVEGPEGFTVDNLPPRLSRFVLHLQMALEGIKQGANLWFKLNKAAWLRLGLRSWLNETNLYRHECGIRIGVFADDTLAGYPKDKRGQYLAMKKEYGKIIKIGTVDTISPALKFTGVQIDRDRKRGTITVRQTRYIEQMETSLKEEKINLQKWDTPHGNSREQRLAFDKILENKESKPIDKIVFLKLMGKLVWPSSMTRPDISMDVSTLCSCVSDPREIHFAAGVVVAGYLVATKDLGITYGGKLRVPYGLPTSPPGFNESGGLHTAHDSSWGTRPKPLGGYVVMYLNGAIDWSAKIVKIVPDSSCEAETAVGSRAAKATCFVRGLLRFHSRPVTAASPIIGDNKAMHTLITHEGASSRTRYYERATLLIKRAVLMLLLTPLLVTTHYMIADMFTKALEKSSFVRFRNVVMNCNCTARESLALALLSLHGKARRMADRLLVQL